MMKTKTRAFKQSHKAVHIRAAAVVIAAAVLSACAEGGGAGDTAFDSDDDAVNLILPFVGVYDLPANWAGIPENDAFLEIQEPGSTGVATAVIYRQNSMDNCIDSRTTFGEVKIDPFLPGNRIVLDGIFELPEAFLSLTTTGLTIELPEDLQDVDDDGNIAEGAFLQADSIGMMSSDLGETCANASIIWIRPRTTYHSRLQVHYPPGQQIESAGLRGS